MKVWCSLAAWKRDRRSRRESRFYRRNRRQNRRGLRCASLSRRCQLHTLWCRISLKKNSRFCLKSRKQRGGFGNNIFETPETPALLRINSLSLQYTSGQHYISEILIRLIFEGHVIQLG